jgi:hypothetical protein
MARNLQNLLALANLCRGLGGVFDLTALLALLKAALPLPKTDADVPGWLTRIGIVDPLAPIAGGLLARLIPDVVPAPLLALTGPNGYAMPVTALPTLATVETFIRPLATDLEVEFGAAGPTEDDLTVIGEELKLQAVPTWLIPLILQILAMIAEWQKNRKPVVPVVPVVPSL